MKCSYSDIDPLLPGNDRPNFATAEAFAKWAATSCSQKRRKGAPKIEWWLIKNAEQSGKRTSEGYAAMASMSQRARRQFLILRIDETEHYRDFVHSLSHCLARLLGYPSQYPGYARGHSPQHCQLETRMAAEMQRWRENGKAPKQRRPKPRLPS